MCKNWLSPPPKIKSLQSYSIVPWSGHINLTWAGNSVGTVLWQRHRKGSQREPGTAGTLVSASARPHRVLRLNKAKNGVTAVAFEQSKERSHCSCMQHSNKTTGTSYSIIAPSPVAVAVVHVDDVSSTSGLYSKSKRSCTSSEKRTSAFVSLFFFSFPPSKIEYECVSEAVFNRIFGDTYFIQGRRWTCFPHRGAHRKKIDLDASELCEK